MSPDLFFLSFSKIFILAYYRDLKRIFRSPRSVIVGHCRSFLVLVCLFKGGCGPKTHRIADFFDQRQTSIIATPQQTFKSDACRWNISSSHVQNTFCLRTLWYGNQTSVVRSGPPAVFLCCLYFVLWREWQGSNNNSQKNDQIADFKPKNTGIHQK